MLSSVGMVKAQQNPSHLKLCKNEDEAWVVFFIILNIYKLQRIFTSTLHYQGRDNSVIKSFCPSSAPDTVLNVCHMNKNPTPTILPLSPDPSFISTQTPDSPTHTAAGSSASSNIFHQLLDA